jgi:predicted ATP-binding protein involved in virulence
MAGSTNKPTDTNSPKELGAYFLSFSLENVRSFSTKQTLRLTDKEGQPARWTIILGDNGVGKTTLLRGLAALGSFTNRISYLPNFSGSGRVLRSIHKSSRGVRGMQFNYVDSMTGLGKTAAMANIFTSLAALDSAYFVRDEKLETTLECQYILGAGFEKKSVHTSDARGFEPRRTGVKIVEGYAQFLPESEFYIDVLNCYGYGAARRIGNSAITNTVVDLPSANLFNDEAVLLNAEEWLIQTDYKALREENTQTVKKKDKVMSILKRLLRGEVSDIRIESSNKVPQVLFKTHYGWVALHELSLGYKTLIAWMIDFASRMLDRYEDVDNPLEQPAVLLIDEIDLHLHPKLQRELIHFLTETFPRTQFIATAHSPLIAQAAEDANLVLLKRKGNQVIINNDPVSIKNWRVDQILTSDLFDVDSARSPSTAKLLEERTKILSKKQLSDRDEKRLKALESQIGELPVGETPAEERAFSAIDRIAMILADSQKSTSEDASNESAK